MLNIYLFLGLCLIIWYFIHIRKISETAIMQAKKYCQHKELQYLSLSRKYSRLSFSKAKGLYWKSAFVIEFSGDGESSNNATMIINNLKLESIDIPVYRV